MDPWRVSRGLLLIEEVELLQGPLGGEQGPGGMAAKLVKGVAHNNLLKTS